MTSAIPGSTSPDASIEESRVKFVQHPAFSFHVKGVFGVGSRLKESDIGQLFIKIAPFKRDNYGGFDWAFMPLRPKDINDFTYKLVEFAEDHFTIQRTDADQMKFKLPLYWNSRAWILVQNHQQFLVNHKPYS